MFDVRRRLQYARRHSVTVTLAPQRLSKASRRLANSVGVSQRLSKSYRHSATPNRAPQGVGVQIISNVGVQMLGIQFFLEKGVFE